MKGDGRLLGHEKWSTPEEHRAAMWALWHGQLLHSRITGTREERFKILDYFTETFNRETAPREIDLWQADAHTCQGVAYRTYMDLKQSNQLG